MSIINETIRVKDYAREAGLLNNPDRVRAAVMTRFSPLVGIGQDLRQSTSYAEALSVSGLGFEPFVTKLKTEAGKDIKGYKGIFNGDHELSVVKNDYTVVSNSEAFAIAEDLVSYEGFTYEVGNIVNNGARCRLVLSGPTVSIEGDEFTSYAVFNNSFDLSKSVSVQFMFLRLASLSGIMRKSRRFASCVTFTHFGAKAPKLRKLSQFQLQYSKSISYLQAEAAAFRKTLFTRQDFIDEIIPLVVSHTFQRPKDALITERQQTRTLSFVDSLLSAYDRSDLNMFDGTAYRVFLAMADIDSHIAPFVNRSNPDLYINRVLQDGLRPSLANVVGDYFIDSRKLIIR